MVPQVVEKTPSERRKWSLYIVDGSSVAFELVTYFVLIYSIFFANVEK